MCFLRQPVGNGMTESKQQPVHYWGLKRYRETKKIENLALQRRVIEQRVQREKERDHFHKKCRNGEKHLNRTEQIDPNLSCAIFFACFSFLNRVSPFSML